MSAVIHRRPSGLRVDVQPDGWAYISRPGDETGIALDPKFFAIWSAAQGCTARELARGVGVSDYLASSALTALALGGLIEREPWAPQAAIESLSCRFAMASISVLVVHCCREGDLHHSVESVLEQAYPGLSEVVVITEIPTSYRERGVRVTRCEDVWAVDSLIEQASELTGEALLLMDSRVSLAPGALEDMVYALQLRSDVAAVTPRIMWDRWPGFVVALGEWETTVGRPFSPCTGHLDVGQFQRWQEVPAISAWSGLIRREALEEIAQRKSDGTTTRLDEWCLQARLAGSHIVAATCAVAYAPWCDPARQSGEAGEAAQATRRRSYPTESVDQLPEISVRYTQWPGGLPALEVDEMLHKGRPALTIEGVRGFYSHYPAVAPLPIRRRVTFVGQEIARHRHMAQQLSRDCDVHWVSSCETEDDRAVLSCQAADLLFTTADSLMRCASLQQVEQPILVDTQSPVTLADGVGTTDSDPLGKQVDALEKRPWDWLEVVDGIVCASEEERLYWLGALAARGRLNPYVRSVHSDLLDFVMVVPTGVEAITPPSQSILKGVHPGVDAEDRVILWCGPLRAFDDPMTAIRAFEALSSFGDHLKLLFAAFEDQEEDAETLRSAIQLANDLGLTERVLFERHIPRHLRDGYLSEADLAVALGRRVLEAQLGGPVALSACIGAGLPMIVTDRHAGSELIQQYALGQAVSAGDLLAVAEAFRARLECPKDAYSEAFAEARQALAWPEVMIPLVDFCRRPHYALDRFVEKLLFCEAPTPPPGAGSLRRLLLKAWRLHQQQGLQATISEARRYLRWKAGV